MTTKLKILFIFIQIIFYFWLMTYLWSLISYDNTYLVLLGIVGNAGILLFGSSSIFKQIENLFIKKEEIV